MDWIVNILEAVSLGQEIEPRTGKVLTQREETGSKLMNFKNTPNPTDHSSNNRTLPPATHTVVKTDF